MNDEPSMVEEEFESSEKNFDSLVETIECSSKHLNYRMKWLIGTLIAFWLTILFCAWYSFHEMGFTKQTTVINVYVNRTM